jgi:hypothetical protein
VRGLSRPARAPVTLKTLLCLTDKQPPVRDPGAQWPSVQPVAGRHWAIPPVANVSEFTCAAEGNVADRGVELIRGDIQIDAAVGAPLPPQPKLRIRGCSCGRLPGPPRPPCVYAAGAAWEKYARTARTWQDVDARAGPLHLRRPQRLWLEVVRCEIQ